MSVESSTEIKVDDVSRFVIDTLSETGEKATISSYDLASLIRSTFKATDSQVAGLIHRLSNSKGIIERVGRGTYRLCGERNIVEEFVSETDLLLKRLTARVRAGILDLESDELVTVQKYLKDIDSLKTALQNKPTVEVF